MPRTNPAEVKVIKGPNGLVAAAARLTGPNRSKSPKKAPPWYTQAWNFYDTIGEYRYACSWVGNLLSRAVLEVWEGGKVSKNPEAIAALAAFFGGPNGQSEMLRQSGTHLTVPGDMYYVGQDMGDAPDKWMVASATRLKRVGGTDEDPTGATWKLGTKELDDPLVIRVWRPHPNDETKSDSPSRAVLPVLSELDALGKSVAAQLSSRLTGAGVFAIPNEMTFGTVRGQVTNGDETDDAVGVNTGLQAFLMELYETMAAAMANPEDPSSRVPVLIQGPGEYLKSMRHITFWSELDAKASELRDELIRRLALGMDMPPEVLTGAGDLNHWNAWQVEEASIKAHTEPLLQLITSAITEQYLWPYLIDTGMSEEEARVFVIHADTSKIRLRPNRSKEAIELYDRGALSRAAMLRENGFDPADEMDDKERTEWHLRKVASGSTTPELVAWALSQMGLAVPATAYAPPTEAPQPRSLTEHPENALPEREESDTEAMYASEVAVFRALERAGARLRTKYRERLVSGADQIANAHLYRYAQITPDMYDDLLAGSWDICDALDIHMSPARMDAYVRHLFQTQKEFTSRTYARFLMTQTVVAA